MKLVKKRLEDKTLIAYITPFVVYGRNYDNTYQLILQFSGTDNTWPIILYRKLKKPRFKNIVLMSILWAIPSLIMVGIMYVVATIFIILSDFLIQWFFKRRHALEGSELISGIVTVFFYIVGLVGSIWHIIQLIR